MNQLKDDVNIQTSERSKIFLLKYTQEKVKLWFSLPACALSDTDTSTCTCGQCRIKEGMESKMGLYSVQKASKVFWTWKGG